MDFTQPVLQNYMNSSQPLNYVLTNVSTDIPIPLLSAAWSSHCTSPSLIGVFCVNATSGQLYIIPMYKDLFTSGRVFSINIGVRNDAKWPAIIQSIVVKLKIIDTSNKANRCMTESCMHDSVTVHHKTEHHENATLAAFEQPEVITKYTTGFSLLLKRLTLLIPVICISAAFVLPFCVNFICYLCAARKYVSRKRNASRWQQVGSNQLCVNTPVVDIEIEEQNEASGNLFLSSISFFNWLI